MLTEREFLLVVKIYCKRKNTDTDITRGKNLYLFLYLSLRRLKKKLIKILPAMMQFIILLLLAPALMFQPEPEPFVLTWHIVVALLAGLYEVVARLIPTVNNYSWIAKIIEILTWISNFLNNKKRSK